MLIEGLIDIERMQSVIKVFVFCFCFCLFLFFKNCYYFSDLETQWPRNPELKSSSSDLAWIFMAQMGPLKKRFCLSSTVIRGGKSQYWRKKSLSSVSELGLFILIYDLHINNQCVSCIWHKMFNIVKWCYIYMCI